MSDFYENVDLKYTEVAVLTSTCNKYHPGMQTFYLQSMNPMNTKSKDKSTVNIDNSNLQNKESTEASSLEYGSNIELEMPKEVARNFPTKFIPPGTRFLLSFIGGDLTKPVIVGRDYSGYTVLDT